MATLEQSNELLSDIVPFCRECTGAKRYFLGGVETYAAYVGTEYHRNFDEDVSSVDFLGYFRPLLENFNHNSNIDMIGFETALTQYELNAILSWANQYYQNRSLSTFP